MLMKKKKTIHAQIILTVGRFRSRAVVSTSAYYGEHRADYTRSITGRTYVFSVRRARYDFPTEGEQKKEKKKESNNVYGHCDRKQILRGHYTLL